MLFVARIVDGLSGGNISTARAYVADITEPKDRARAYGLIGAAFGLGFILGPALSGVLAGVSYTAPIWAAAAITLVADGHGVAVAAGNRPSRAGRHRQSAPVRCRRCCIGRCIRRVLAIDFVYWLAFAIFQTTLVAVRRASGSGSARSQTGYLFAAFGLLGAVIQGGLIRPSSIAWATSRRSSSGSASARSGWSRSRSRTRCRCSRSRSCRWRIGIGFGHPTMSSLVSLVARGDEQGRVQGAASAVESLGRTIGPIWGNASLQHFGESMPYISAAALLLLTLALTVGFHVLTGRDRASGPVIGRAGTLDDGRSAIRDLRERVPNRTIRSEVAWSMRADEAEQAAQAVERLDHRREQGGIAAVAREHLADRQFESADHLFGLLTLLIRHVSLSFGFVGLEALELRFGERPVHFARAVQRLHRAPTRQPRQPHALQRNGARPVTCRRTRSIHDRERERCVDAWHAGHITVTLQTIPDLSSSVLADRAAASGFDTARAQRSAASKKRDGTNSRNR